MPVSSSTEHWIKPDALTINLNHFGDPDYLQVSLLAGAVVMAFKQDVIGYNAAHNYRTWPLEAANTYLETSSAYNVYARLTRSEVNARALVIYDPILRDVEGREITYEKNEETGEVKEILGEPNENFYFIFLGQLSSSISEDGRSVFREWTSEYRSGSLETNEQLNDWMAILNKMFRPHYDDPLNPDTLTWIEAKSHMGIQGGVTMFIEGEGMDLPSIYDNLPIDNDTIYWGEIKDEEGNVIDKRIKARVGSGEGGITPTLLGDLTNVGSWANAVAIEDRIMVQRKDSASWTPLSLSEICGGSADFSNVLYSGEGNAFTSFVLSEDKKTLTFVKGQTFALQTELDKKWTTDSAKIENWNTAYGWGDHSTAGYMKKEVIYDESIGCWKLVGDLLVTGGITMFANDGTYTPSTITDAVNIDGNTLVRVNGMIMLNPDIEFGGGVADSVAWSDVTGKPTWIGNSKPSYTTSEVTERTNLYFTNERAVSALSDTLKGYLPLTGGTITGDLRLRKGSEYTSPYLYFGDRDEVWLKEVTDTHLTIHADGSVKIDSPKTIIDGIEIKKSDSGVLFIDANLVVSGGITMYGTDGTTAPSIWDGAPIATTSVKGVASFDSNYFAVNNGKVTFIGSTGGGVADSVAWDDVTGKPSWIGSSKPSYSYSEITGTPTIPNNTNQLTNGAGFITSSGSITGNAATSTKVHVTSVANTGPFPIIYTDVTAIGSSGYRSLYCTSKSGTGYNPVNDTLVASCFSGSSVSFGDGTYANLTTKGWYRFAIGGYENSQAGAYIFFIRRQYQTSRNESFVISATVDYGRVVFNQISGATTDNLISKIRATNVLDGRVHFDFYYEGSSSAHRVYVNAIGNATLQVPTSVLSAYSYVTEMSLKDGFVAGKSLTCYDYKNLAFIHQKSGKNLLTNGDVMVKGNAYAMGSYSYDSSVTNGRTYRLTICAKLGSENTHIAAYWDGGTGNNTTITGLSSKEERIISFTAKITNKQVLTFYQFPNGKFGSYIRWAYLEEAYKEGELSTTTDYNNWLTEYNKLDTKSFLYKIRRIDVGDSYWSADKGIVMKGSLTLDGTIYSPNSVTAMKIANNSGTYIGVMSMDAANNFCLGYDSSTSSYDTYVDGFNMHFRTGNTHSEIFTLDSAGGAKLYLKTSALVIKRNHSSGGAYTQYQPCNQENQSWAAGVNNSYQYSWWYQNVSSGIDAQKMYLDSSGKLVVLDTVEAGGMFNIQSTGTYHKMRLFTENSNYYATGGATFLQAGNYAGTSTKGNLFLSGINVSDLTLCKIYGPLLVTSGITMYSDIRKKTILNHVELSLKEVADAPLIEHYYNSDEAKTTHVGSVAQYWAGLNDWFCKEDGEGFLTMEIQNAALASAISVARELTRYESKTDKQIKKLKKRIGELEEEIENLKNK